MDGDEEEENDGESRRYPTKLRGRGGFGHAQGTGRGARYLNSGLSLEAGSSYTYSRRGSNGAPHFQYVSATVRSAQRACSSRQRERKGKRWLRGRWHMGCYVNLEPQVHVSRMLNITRPSYVPA